MDVNIKIDKNTGSPLGYAFVTLETHAQAAACFFNLSGISLHNKVLRVGKYNDSNLYIDIYII